MGTSGVRAGLCHLQGAGGNTRTQAHTPPRTAVIRRDTFAFSTKPLPVPRRTGPDKQRSAAETEISIIPPAPGAEIKQKPTLLQAQCLSKKPLLRASQKSILLSNKYWPGALWGFEGPQGSRKGGPCSPRMQTDNPGPLSTGLCHVLCHLIWESEARRRNRLARVPE